MPPQYRRYAPFILIAILLLFLLPVLRGSKSSSTLSSKDRAARTRDAVSKIDSGEQAYRTAHGRYTSHLADLVASTKGLGGDLAIGLSVQLDVSTDGQTYVAQVTSDVLSFVRGRTRGKITTSSCLRLKSGVDCVVAPTKKK